MKMASDESMSIRSYISIQEDEDDDDITDEAVDDHDHRLCESHPHNFSRLSMCTSTSFCGADDDDDEAEDNDMRMYMSRLSIESFDGDLDDQFSDHDKQEGTLTASDSDKDVGCYSLPATPPRRRCLAAAVNQHRMGVLKGYASENEVGEHHMGGQKMMYYSSRNERRRKRVRARRMRMTMMSRRNKKDEMEMEMEMEMESGSAGESEVGSMAVGGGGGGGGGLVVITRPKGGRRSLCMDMEEVKACRDLGFELEHQSMMEMSTTTTTPFSFDTASASSGGNSPIANWRISSPGDDPRDVKARLKVWAQAVALASASRHSS